MAPIANRYRDRVMDAVHCRTANAAADGAFHVLNVLQAVHHPADQVLGLACAFKKMTDTLGISVGELFAVIDRMEADCRYRQVNTLSAVQRYVENEIKAKYR